MNTKEKMDVSKKKKILLCGILIAVLILFIGTAVFASNPYKKFDKYIEKEIYHKAVQIYNSRIIGTDDEEKYTQKLMVCVSDIVSSWAANEKNYDDTVEGLKYLIQSGNREVSSCASEKLTFVITEGEGNKYYSEAEQLCNEMQYAKAMQSIQLIDKSFSEYDSVEVLYRNCKNTFLEKISNPQTVEDYENAIKQLEECIVVVSDDDLLNRKSQIEKDFISDIVCFWSEENITYENAVILLEKLGQSVYPEISTLASETLSFITIEEEGNKYHLLAEDYYEQKNYIEVMQTIKLIDKQYSQYEPAKELYDLCKNIILQYASDVKTVEEYEEAIQQLDEYINIIDETEFVAKRMQLEKELSVVKDVFDIVEQAKQLYQKGSYKSAFSRIETGLTKYTDNEMLKETLEFFHEVYIVDITSQAKAACEAEDYNTALNIVNNAILQYDCDELRAVLETVKEEKNILYKIKNQITNGIESFVQGWDKENLDVQQLGEDAANYVVKSGEKLLLGDYSEENITVLSMGGNIVSAIANLDLLFDIRDLTYDIQHFADEKYMIAYIAADVVALLPVIGVVKYIKYLDDAKDIGKTADNVADIADAIGDTVKTADKIGEAVDEATDAIKNTENVVDTVTDATKHYEYIKTRNAHLAGDVHPKTGVPFVNKKVEYSDGRLIEGVFAQFDSKIDIQLPESLYKVKFSKQQEHLLEELQKMAQKQDASILEKFSKDEIDDILEGVLPEGYTWHHNEQEGLMQLVDSAVHAVTGHDGGMSLWGIGY